MSDPADFHYLVLDFTNTLTFIEDLARRGRETTRNRCPPIGNDDKEIIRHILSPSWDRIFEIECLATRLR